MTIKQDYDFNDLQKNCWQGATDTLEVIYEENKEDELMWLLEEMFSDVPTMTEVNDFLWFDREYIFESLGINEEDEQEDDDDEVE